MPPSTAMVQMKFHKRDELSSFTTLLLSSHAQRLGIHFPSTSYAVTHAPKLPKRDFMKTFDERALDYHHCHSFNDSRQGSPHYEVDEDECDDAESEASVSLHSDHSARTFPPFPRAVRPTLMV
ncbi:hypothetical protein CC2G_005150 [Coprinopsis cinerea AmutBmut pab1-1]|nr:hypothetical protein CC2G_005150 [Coprinopsis cinerea AmutBmut pab1-1]